MVKNSDMTLALVVDSRGLEQLSHTIPTWQLHRPELFDMPWVVLYDGQVDEGLVRGLFGRFGVIPLCIAWEPNMEYETQREKMLTAFICGVPKYVKTAHWWKIDTDALATEHTNWTAEDLLANVNGKRVCWVASSWAYTKAKGGGGTAFEWAEELEVFGDFIAVHPRLGLVNHIDGRRIKYPRMASWVSVYNTEWTQWLMGKCRELCGPDMMPIPSQDTVAWYAATRMRQHTLAPRRWAKKLGWQNIPNTEKLAARCAEVVAESQITLST